jgi:hypothetical protein
MIYSYITSLNDRHSVEFFIWFGLSAEVLFMLALSLGCFFEMFFVHTSYGTTTTPSWVVPVEGPLMPLH